MKLREWVREARENFTCDVCGREVFAGERVCEKCRKELPFHKKVCPLCGREVREEGVCLECKEEPPGVAKARSVCEHDGEAAGLVVRFKRGKPYLKEALAELSAPVFLREFPETELLVPVPMTPSAEKKRGYNQSLKYAEALAARTGIAFCDAAEKTKETPSQKSLGRKDRAENLAGCFRVKDRAAVKGKCVAIVDDAMTTGATAAALARPLLRAGAKEVVLFTFTSVTRKDPFGKPEKKKRGMGSKKA